MTTMRTPSTEWVAPTSRLILTLHHPRPGAVLVRAHGEVDLGTVEDLRAVLDRAVREPHPVTGSEPDHLVWDLDGITFFSAAGVGALAEAGDAARRRGADLHLIASTRPVRRVLALCGLDEEWPMAPRLVDALCRTSPGAPAPRSAP
jgi:anti-anti-sigma factor